MQNLLIRFGNSFCICFLLAAFGEQRVKPGRNAPLQPGGATRKLPASVLVVRLRGHARPSHTCFFDAHSYGPWEDVSSRPFASFSQFSSRPLRAKPDIRI